MIGLIWAGIYAVIEQVSPGAFSAPLSVVFEDVGITTRTIYFSFVTLLTLGYGDVVPLSATARAFAIIETFVGQVMLVVLIARLVGLHVAQTSE
jgi:voltage-gated potassium channel Kch